MLSVVRSPTQTHRGHVPELVVADGEWIVVDGAVEDAKVEANGALTVHGAAIDVELDGENAACLVTGAVTGTLKVSPGTTAIVHGVVTGTIINQGRLMFEGEVIGGRVETSEDGIQVGMAAVPEELREQLGTVTITRDRPS